MPKQFQFHFAVCDIEESNDFIFRHYKNLLHENKFRVKDFRIARSKKSIHIYLKLKQNLRLACFGKRKFALNGVHPEWKRDIRGCKRFCRKYPEHWRPFEFTKIDDEEKIVIHEVDESQKEKNYLFGEKEQAIKPSQLSKQQDFSPKDVQRIRSDLERLISEGGIKKEEAIDLIRLLSGFAQCIALDFSWYRPFE